MKKVLFISYHFPPIAMSQRSLKFVKYLPKFGWRPIVLTPKKSNYPRIDNTLLEQIPKQCTIIRLDSCEKYPVSPIIRTSDFLEGWFPMALKEGVKAIEEKNIDVIYSVAQPYLSLIVGVALKRLTGKPLVIDFRDEWTTNPFIRNINWNHEQSLLTKQFEKHVLKNADAVISVRDEIISTLNRISGGQHPSKFHSIPNGFDPLDFEHLRPIPPKKQFTMGYMGSIYGIRLATANLFYKSLNTAIHNNKILSNQIKLLLIGTLPKIPYTNVTRIASRTGFVNHHTALTYAASCDLLLLFIDPREGNQIVTSKIYEYINLGKPILAIVPPKGAAANIIRETRTGVVIDSRTPASAIPVIIKNIQTWQMSTDSLNPNIIEIQKYDRKKQAGKLASIMNQLILDP